jgi:hypothetical protein
VMASTANPKGRRSGCWCRAAATVATVAAIAVTLCSAPSARADAERQVSPDPSRTDPIHQIPIFDEDNGTIRPGDENVRPMSSRVTCNKCHDYSKIAGGWHFNSTAPGVAPGRPGEPWIVADVATGTQIPISARGWKGTWKPDDVGISAWAFVKRFGRHMPGGGMGENYPVDKMDPASRWPLSGNLEINCLGCHNGSRRQDQAAWATHVVGRENFRWAATAASGIAHVEGFVGKLPSSFDPELSFQADYPAWVPHVTYRPGAMNPKGEVFFDVRRKMPAGRCYYCHTAHPAAKAERCVAEDIHMARGFACTDCHTNGLDHRISRNYEGDPSGDGTRTCRGCHLGDGSAVTVSGREGGHLATPRPRHAGFPQVHFDKLACTACHGGPWPQARTVRVQTSRAHGLGYHAMGFDPKGAPVIQEPVFAKGPDGKLAPHRLMYPAFWARMGTDGSLTPMLPELVAERTGWILKVRPNVVPKPPTKQKIYDALKALAAEAGQGKPVYVGNGKVYTAGDANSLLTGEHEAAQPYVWPIAHDVRPTVQALGYGGAAGCQHCHSTDSAFLFGQVSAAGPSELGADELAAMARYTGEDATYHKLFSTTFVFRPWLKLTAAMAACVMALVLAAYGLAGLRGLLGAFGWKAGE